MAAGIVYHNITTSSGVTFSIACWVPNTAAPDVGAIPVSLPITAAGGALDLTTLAGITATANALDVNLKSGGTPVGTGADSMGALVTFTAEGKAQLGSITETAPASDTASSGLNGRLQWLAQKLTAFSAPIAPATATATKALTIGAQYNSTAPTFTNGQQGSLQVDANGNLNVAVKDALVLGPFSATANGNLLLLPDTAGYATVVIQIVSAGAATLNVEQSNDGTTFVQFAGMNYSSQPQSSPFLTNGVGVGEYVFPIYGKQLQLRLSAYSSGTITIQVTLRKDPVRLPSVSGTLNDGTAPGSTGLAAMFEARTTNKSAQSSGFAIRPIATSIGAAINKPYQVPELDWFSSAGASGIVNTTTAVTLVAAAGAGIRNYITALDISTDTLGAVTEVVIRDGAAGTVIWRGKLQTGPLPVTRITFASPRKSSANTLLEVATLTAVTGGVYVNAEGYQAP